MHSWQGRRDHLETDQRTQEDRRIDQEHLFRQIPATFRWPKVFNRFERFTFFKPPAMPVVYDFFQAQSAGAFRHCRVALPASELSVSSSEEPMSLIIGVRCKNGCLVIADRRTHIKSNGTETYQDNFDKVLLL
ncbi:MAG: hypothetical protein NWE89_14405 [Candidatus Bathyarchaeota archaeon]|nr:hypothetical protein [Candidatus Bathyarchaeota archaeon]